MSEEVERLEYILDALDSVMWYPYSGTLSDEDLDDIERITKTLKARLEVFKDDDTERAIAQHEAERDLQ